MKFLLLLVFGFGVEANFVQSFENKCGIGYDNEEDVTNENNIIKPCPKNDYKCMRNFLAENSKCEPSYYPVQDPLYLAQTTFYFAYANMTFIYTNYTTNGLKKATIITFDLNEITGDLVIAIKIPALTINIPKLVVIYRRPGQESVVKSDVANVTFRSLILTVTLNKKEKLSLEKAEIQPGYVGERIPDFYIGPAAYTSKDPIVQAEYPGFMDNIPLAVKNTFLFHAKILASLFIQSICDFGIDLYSI